MLHGTFRPNENVEEMDMKTKKIVSFFLGLLMVITGINAHAAQTLRDDALAALNTLGLFVGTAYEETVLPAQSDAAPQGRTRYAVYSVDNTSAFLQICASDGACLSFALQIDGAMTGETAENAIKALMQVIEPTVFDEEKAADALQSMKAMQDYHARLSAQLDAVNGTKTESEVYASYFTDAWMYEWTDRFFFATVRGK